MSAIKKRVVGEYFIWQIEAYGNPYLYADLPADIYKIRLMPSTPQGDLVGEVETAAAADALLDDLDGKSLQSAKEKVSAARRS